MGINIRFNGIGVILGWKDIICISGIIKDETTITVCKKIYCW